MVHMETTDTKKFSRKLTRWAVGVSVAYAGLLVWLVWVRLDKLPTMELNTIGDFLAGAFSPLAFLWLVVGYFQQGHELSASVAQLERQATTFDAQRREDQERFIAATTPNISYSAAAFENAAGTPTGWYVKFTNIGGAPCSEIQLSLEDRRLDLAEDVIRTLAIQQGEIASLYWARGVMPSPITFQLKVTYLQGSLGLRTDFVDLEFYVRDEHLYLQIVPGSKHETRQS